MQRSVKILDRVVFGGLLAVMALAIVPYGAVDLWWESAVVCAILALTALWVFEVLLRGSWQIRKWPVLLPMIAVTAYIYLQAAQWPPQWLAKSGGSTPRPLLSIDHYQTLLTARKSLALTLFFGLLLAHTATPKRLQWIVRTIIGLGLASAIFGLLRQFLQLPDSTGGFVLPFLFYGSGYGQFISPNAFAYLMEMTVGLLGGLILGGGVRRNRLPIYLAVSAIVWTALVLSNSRGALLGLACQLIFVLFVSMNWYAANASGSDRKVDALLGYLRASIPVRVCIVLLLLATLSVGVLWIGGESLVGKLTSQTDVSSQGRIDGDTRKEIWGATWRLIKQNPWTGVGFGAYFLGIPQHQLSSGRVKLEQAHNDYLDLAASGGLVGVLLAIWFFAMIIRQARHSFRVRDAYQRAAALGAAAALLGVSVHSVVDFGLQLTGLAIVFAATIVVLVANPESKYIVAAK